MLQNHILPPVISSMHRWLSKTSLYRLLRKEKISSQTSWGCFIETGRCNGYLRQSEKRNYLEATYFTGETANVSEGIRFLQGKASNGTTTMVTIQDAAGNWVELTSKQDIEHTIIQNNQEKFQQSFNTPFMKSRKPRWLTTPATLWVMLLWGDHLRP